MIYVTGDIHGDFNDYRVTTFIPKIMGKDDYLIICGDFGFDWNESLKLKYSELKFNGTILFIDGNHENFDILNSLPTKEMFGSDVGVFCETEDNHTYHLRRGRMYEVNGKKFFCFGGGNSIDKDWRIEEETRTGKKHTLWWEQELPTEEELEFAKKTLYDNKYIFDYFITHTCASNIKSYVLNAHNMGFYDNTESMISNIEYIIKENGGKYKGHFFGHFHTNCGIGNEHCLYENIVNLDENYVIAQRGNRYKFNINGNPSRSDLGERI